MNIEQKSKHVNAFTGWKLWRLWPLVMLVRLWWKTLRIEIDPEARKQLNDISRPMINILWHNQIFAITEFLYRYRKGQRMYGLVSASKDGAWLDAFFKLIGVGTIRGSSSFRGRQAIKEILHVLESGHDFAITPDGPRGPCYEMKASPLLIAEKSPNARIFLASINYKKGSSWRLKSWDRFHIPKPFTKITFKCIHFDNYNALLNALEEGEAPIEHLKLKLMSIQGEDECK